MRFKKHRNEESPCCDSPKISKEDGFYVCLNCGIVTKKNKENEESPCCDSPKISKEDGFYVCLNCGIVTKKNKENERKRSYHN